MLFMRFATAQSPRPPEAKLGALSLTIVCLLVACDSSAPGTFPPEDPELANAASLEERMTLIGRRAQERGLTEAKLQAILDEA